MKFSTASQNVQRRGLAAGGFTLMELMIVVTIMAIIAAVAIPSYLQYSKRANRSAAAQIMLNISNRQEQYILDARSYSGNLGSGGLNIAHDGWTCTNDTAVPSTSTCSNAFYTVSATLATVPPPGYTITAAPIAGRTQADDGTLTLTSAGLRTRSAGDGRW